MNQIDIKRRIIVTNLCNQHEGIPKKHFSKRKSSLNDRVLFITETFGMSISQKMSISPQNCAIFGEILTKIFTNFKVAKKIFLTAESASCVNSKQAAKDLQLLTHQIFPLEFFGSVWNQKQFCRSLVKIASASQFQKCFESTVIKNFQLKNVRYLDGLSNSDQVMCMIQILWWAIDDVMMVLDCAKYYKTAVRRPSHRIIRIPHQVWSKICKKKIKSYKREKRIEIVKEPNKINMENLGKLKFLPYDDDHVEKVRPIVRFNSVDHHKKYLVEFVKSLVLNRLSCEFPKKISKFFGEIRLAPQGTKLYAVVLDVIDAYGSVDVEKLIDILKRSCTTQNGGGTTRRACFLPEISATDKINRVNHLINSLFLQISGSNVTYKWKKGLLQGWFLSGPLYDLYANDFDQRELVALNGANRFLHRVVDDYLFITTNQTDIETFVEAFKRNKIVTKPLKFFDSTNISNSILRYLDFEVDLCSLQLSRVMDLQQKIEEISILNFDEKTPFKIAEQLLSVKRNKVSFDVATTTAVNPVRMRAIESCKSLLRMCMKAAYVMATVYDGRLNRDAKKIAQSVVNQYGQLFHRKLNTFGITKCNGKYFCLHFLIAAARKYRQRKLVQFLVKKERLMRPTVEKEPINDVEYFLHDFYRKKTKMQILKTN